MRNVNASRHVVPSFYHETEVKKNIVTSDKAKVFFQHALSALKFLTQMAIKGHEERQGRMTAEEAEKRRLPTHSVFFFFW